MNETLLNRLRGCAVGAAIGDALGMPLEFGPRATENRLVREMKSGRLPAGSFTDDTEMALALAESLLHQRPLNLEDLAQRFVAWINTNPPDVGMHTSRVLRRIDAGATWEEAVEAAQNQNPDAAGNGSLMRAWPVALAYWDDLDNLLVDSWRQSRVTHPHADTLAASTFLNATLYHIFQGVEPGWAMIFASTLVKMDDDLWKVIESAPYLERDDISNSGWVRHTLQTAVWGITNTESFEEAVVNVVNLGNDADTAGTVVGALAGAYYGLDGIPERWQAALSGEWPLGSGNSWGAEDFVHLADRLAQPQE